MRKRFRGVGDAENGFLEKSGGAGLSENKKNVIDLWFNDDLDDSDKEVLMDKYEITEKDLEKYSELKSANDKEFLEDYEKLDRSYISRTLKEPRKEANNEVIENIRKNTNLEKEHKNSFLGEATGTVLGGMAGNFNRMKNTDFNVQNLAEKAVDFVQYHKNDIDILINKEKIDPKNIQFKISKEIGKHDSMQVSFEVESALIDKFVTMAYTPDSLVEIDLNRIKDKTREEDFKKVFYGVMRKAEVTRTMGEYSKVSLEVSSISILMDREKNYRVFQDVSITYSDLIKTVFKPYEKDIKLHLDRRLEKQIGQVLVQAYESDWEFIKRILSNIGEAGISLTSHLNSIVCGFLELTTYEANIINSEFTKGRDGKNIFFKIKGTDPYNPVEKVNIIVPYDNEQGVKIVYSSKMWLENDVVNCEYVVIDSDKESGHIFPTITNSILNGLIIEGSVIEVGEAEGIAVMTLDLSSGLAKFKDRDIKVYPDEYAGSFHFPYSTPYSQSNTGFEPTPEAGDIVTLAFQGTTEKTAFVMGCVNSPGNARFSNRDNRNFGSSPNGNGQPMFDFTLNKEQFIVNVTDIISLSASNKLSMKSTDTRVSTDSYTVNAKSSTEIVEDLKSTVAKEISQVSSGGTAVTAVGLCNINGGGNVIING